MIYATKLHLTSKLTSKSIRQRLTKKMIIDQPHMRFIYIFNYNPYTNDRIGMCLQEKIINSLNLFQKAYPDRKECLVIVRTSASFSFCIFVNLPNLFKQIYDYSKFAVCTTEPVVIRKFYSKRKVFQKLDFSLKYQDTLFDASSFQKTLPDVQDSDVETMDAEHLISFKGRNFLHNGTLEHKRIDFSKDMAFELKMKNKQRKLFLKMDKKRKMAEYETFFCYFDYEAYSPTLDPFCICMLFGSWDEDSEILSKIHKSIYSSFTKVTPKESGSPYITHIFNTSYNSFPNVDTMHIANKHPCYFDSKECENELASESEAPTKGFMLRFVDLMAHLKKMHLPNHDNATINFLTSDDVGAVEMAPENTNLTVFFTIVSLFAAFEELSQIGSSSNLFIYAHNGSRFDFVLLFRMLMQAITPLLENDVKNYVYLQNSGRMIGLDFVYKGLVHVHFRDSILLIPTANKSLAGAAREVGLPQGKIKNPFRTMDYLYTNLNEYIAPTHNHEQVDISNEMQVYMLEASNGEDNFYEIMEWVDPATQAFKDTAPAEPRMTFNSLFYYNLLEYCQQDVIVLMQLLNYFYTKCVFPYVSHVKEHPISSLSYRSISSLMYGELEISVYEEIPGQIWIPIGNYAATLQHTVYGGRTSSSIIGSNKHLPKDITTLIWDSKEIMSSMLIDYADEIKSFSDVITIMQNNTESIINKNDNRLKWQALFTQTQLHMDICSMYPSSLCAPVPFGRFLPITQDLLDEVNFSLKTFSFDPFDYPCLFMYCKVDGIKSNLVESLSDCNNHHKLVFSSVPYHPRNKSKKNSEITNGHAGGLFWVTGENIFGWYNSYDVYNMMEDGYLVQGFLSDQEDTSSKEHSTSLYMDGGWHETAVKKFFQGMFRMKSEGEAERNKGKKACGKVAINATYGKTLTKMVGKFNYKLNTRFDNTAASHVAFKSSFYNYQRKSYDEKNTNTTSYFNAYNSDDMQNSKMRHVGSLCLSGSRIMFRQFRDLLYDGYNRLLIDFPECFSTEYNFIMTYADTDSISCSSGPALFAFDPKKHIGKEIGELIPKVRSETGQSKTQYNFNLVFEPNSGDGCPYFSSINTKLVDAPCFNLELVLAKKFYSFTCIFCSTQKVRAKGHFMNNDLKEMMKTSTLSHIMTFNTLMTQKHWDKLQYSDLFNTELSAVHSDYYVRVLREWNIFNCQIPRTLVDRFKTRAWYDLSLTSDDLDFIEYHTSLYEDLHLNKKRALLKACSGDPLQTDRSSMKVTLFTKSCQTGAVFTVRSSKLSRGVFICQDPYLTKCVNCSTNLPQYFNYKLFSNYVDENK